MSEQTEKSIPPVIGPVCTKERFSAVTGLSEDVIRGMIERGHLPSVKIGKHRLVNAALLTNECLSLDFDK